MVTQEGATTPFEKALMKKLSGTQLNKEQIRALSSSLKKYHDEGLLIHSWRELGKPNPDEFILRGQVKADRLSLLNRLVFEDYIREIIQRKIGVVEIEAVQFEANISL